MDDILYLLNTSSIHMLKALIYMFRKYNMVKVNH